MCCEWWLSSPPCWREPTCCGDSKDENPVEVGGIERCRQNGDIGVDGHIGPDLPVPAVFPFHLRAILDSSEPPEPNNSPFAETSQVQFLSLAICEILFSRTRWRGRGWGGLWYTLLVSQALLL